MRILFSDAFLFILNFSLTRSNFYLAHFQYIFLNKYFVGKKIYDSSKKETTQ
jgi:hypothetical protein